MISLSLQKNRVSVVGAMPYRGIVISREDRAKHTYAITQTDREFLDYPGI